MPVRGVCLSTNSVPADTATEGAGSAWSPFHHKAYAVLWIATVVSNIGTWMYNAASGWLMTGLDPDPFIVAMVQVATTLPMFLFALPAGALADIIDKRRFLIAVEVATTAVSAIYAAIVGLGLATPGNLLLFTFLIGAGGALTAAAWQSIVPQLVPKQDLHPAVAANSVGINVSRALGPVLGGLIVGTVGIAAPFWLNAIPISASSAHSCGGDRPRRAVTCRPSFASATRTGFRHARSNPHLRATLDTRRGILPVRQRLLGAASACCARPDCGRTGTL